MKYIKIIFTFLILGLITYSCLDTDVLLGNVFSEEENVACEEAQTALNVAAYQFAFTDSINYTTNCQQYAAALETAISTCGDELGLLSSKLDALLENDCVFPGDDCNNYIELSAIAREAYNNADETTFVAKCIAYKEALTAQKTHCGDPTGILQTTIDNLDCTLSTDLTCADYEAATAEAAADFAASPTPENCAAYKTALQNQIANCEDTNGILALTLSSLGDCSVSSTLTCDEAIAFTGLVRESYAAFGGNTGDQTNPLWQAACQAFKAALIQEIEICNGSQNAEVELSELACNN